MKRKLSLQIMILVVLASPALADPDMGPVIVDRVTGYYGSTGGEFTITFSSQTSSLDTVAYSDSPKQTRDVYINDGTGPYYEGDTWGYGTPDGSFQTFCVEKTEYVYPPHIIEKAYMSTDVQWNGTPPSSTPLAYEVAYIYNQFATGNLSGYRYDQVGADRQSDAIDLQRAIWALQGYTESLSTKAQGWYDDAVAKVSSSQWVGFGNVRVLNLEDNTVPTPRQSMLYVVPVPGAVLLGFLGLGAAGMRLRKMV